MKLRIATRKSRLAQLQAEIIMELLQEKKGIFSEKILMDTKGDMILDKSLDKIGGKGLFTKEIEMALLEDRADAAVHSMKDVPHALGEEFEIVAISHREDARDVFISGDGSMLKDLPEGARIGTSSNRRAAQLRELRPDFIIVPIRGNVQTRVSKIESEVLNGIVLAAAGVKRLGMESIITEYLDPDFFIPAVGQGALGVEVAKKNKNSEIFLCLDDRETRICVEAERSFMKELNGGCHSAMGAYSTLEGSELRITGIFLVSDRLVRKTVVGNRNDHIGLGVELAREILKG